MSVTARVTAALEAIEAGDIDLAAAILVDLLEEDAPDFMPHRCDCGARFRWPGELDAHRFNAHGWRAAA